MTTKTLPADLTGGEPKQLGLLRDEVDAMEGAVAALREDLAFEHLRDVDAAVWRFVAEAWTDQDTDHVPSFVALHRHDVDECACYIPVEYLAVSERLTIAGIELLPLGDTEIPTEDVPWFTLQPPVGCVAAVPATGTDPTLMVERAREVAGHSLRILRIALREHRGINDRQLRFRLGTTFALAGRTSGFEQREDVAYELTINGDLIQLASAQPVFQLPAKPTTDIEAKADIALRWMERACLTGEPLIALLYLFFALEALLGDKSEGLKAHGLAFRQVMLGHIAEGSFTHPNETWFLYDRVRSGAVHGEDAPEVSWPTVSSFEWSVRRALNQYISVATAQGITRRGRLLRYLDRHGDRPKLVKWLRTNGGPIWISYLEKLAPSDQTLPDDQSTTAPQQSAQ